jgi:hypothetical protein
MEAILRYHCGVSSSFYIRIALFGFQSATLGVLSLKKLADIAICSKQFINFALLKTSAQAPPFILRHELSTL